MKIVLIGAGNLATNLAFRLSETKHSVEQIYSRTIKSAKLLGEKINTPYTSSLSELREDADIYIFSIKDSALENILLSMPQNSRNALWIHTSGSVGIDIFEEYLPNYGALYPFQTFSKDRLVELKDVPLFIEGSNQEVVETLRTVTSELSDKVYEISSTKRRYLHLTGVLACNFTNHLYHISKNILDEQDLSFDYLLPLIEETTNKIKFLSPKEAQTGPAIRYDLNVINKHLDLIEDDNVRKIYKLLSENIHRMNS